MVNPFIAVLTVVDMIISGLRRDFYAGSFPVEAFLLTRESPEAFLGEKSILVLLE